MAQQLLTFPNFEQPNLPTVMKQRRRSGLKAGKTVGTSWSGVDQRFTMIFQASWIWSCENAFSQKNIKYFVKLFKLTRYRIPTIYAE